MFRDHVVGFVRPAFPPPPPRAVDREPQRWPRDSWAFRISLVGRLAVRPVAANGTRPVPAARNTVSDASADAAIARRSIMWAMVKHIDGTISWWRLRDDYTVSAVLETPPCDAVPDWYAWETRDAEYLFQCVATGVVSWSLPRDTLPAPAKPGAPWIKAGSAVRIMNWPGATPCKQLAKFHGVEGSVLCCSGGDGSQRMAYVVLPPELGDAIPQVPADWLQPLAPGTMVEVAGLPVGEGRELNGTQARIYDGVLREGDEMNVLFAGGAAVRLGIHYLTPMSRIRGLSLRESGPSHNPGWEQVCNFIDDLGESHQFSVKLPYGFKQRLDDAHRRGERAKPWPILIFLHGYRGNSMFHPSRQYARHTRGLAFAAENFIVVSPHCGWHWTSCPHAWLEQLVRYLAAASWVDHSRLYISGVSMGGMSSWELAASCNDIVAAVAPVAAHHGTGRTRYIAERLKSVPVLALSSERDTVCRLQPEVGLWRSLLAEGNERLVAAIVPNLSHGSMFDAAYCQETALYDWLLAHQLGA